MARLFFSLLVLSAGAVVADEACAAVELLYPFDGDVLATREIHLHVASASRVCAARWDCGDAPCALGGDGAPAGEPAWRWCGAPGEVPGARAAALLDGRARSHHAVAVWSDADGAASAADLSLIHISEPTRPY